LALTAKLERDEYEQPRLKSGCDSATNKTSHKVARRFCLKARDCCDVGVRKQGSTALIQHCNQSGGLLTKRLELFITCVQCALHGEALCTQDDSWSRS
ncbi:MAG: hypothetical protein WC889_06060, partial [Myxococcota bacterium]